MCYGSLDPKYGLRDLEARVRPLSRATVPEKEAAQPAQGGVMALLRGAWAKMRRKEVSRV
jgi:hypothetical protein